MNLNVFFKENNIKVENVKYLASDRFKNESGENIEWELLVLSNRDMENLKNKYLKKQIDRKGATRMNFDNQGFTRELMTKCIVYPNLNNKELQDSYGVMDAYDLLQEILTVGEFTALESKIADLHNYAEKEEKMVDDIKNV